VTAAQIDWTLSVLEAHGHVPDVAEDGLRLLARLASMEAGWQAEAVPTALPKRNHFYKDGLHTPDTRCSDDKNALPGLRLDEA
jgi:hypothetical protein